MHLVPAAFLTAILLLVLPALASAQTADAQIERGARALRQGDIDSAIQHLEAGLELAPENAGGLELYTHALLVAGRGEDAEAALERLRALDPSSATDDYLGGLTALKLGDWETARNALTDAGERQPESGVLRLFLAVAQQELGEFATADASLDRAEELDPDLAGQVAYRRGIAAYRQGLMTDADDSFARVLDTLPDSSLSNSATEYRNSMSAEPAAAPDQRFSAYVGMGTGYDSNANLASDSNNVDDDESNAALLLMEVGLGAVLYDGDRASLDATQYANMRFHSQNSEFDVARSRTGLNGRYELAPGVTTQLRYALEKTWADYDSFRLSNSIEPSIQWQWERGLSNFYFRYDAREYEDDINLTVPAGAPGFVDEDALDRDGGVSHVGLEHTLTTPAFGFVGEGFLRFGYHYRGENSDGRDYDSEGHEPLITFGAPLPADLFLILDLRHEWREFDERSSAEAIASGPPDFNTTKNRIDEITRFYIGLQRPFGERIDVNLGYQYTKRDSDLSFFDYDRNVLELVATYRFF